MSDNPAILLELPEDAGGVAVLTLNRPERHNSLELADFEVGKALLAQAEAAGVRGLIVTGAGEKTFCAGASLGDVGAGGGAAFVPGANPLTQFCDALEAFPAPTVCSLNGGVYGGGVEIALSCDFRVGGAGMKAFVPPARLGIHYEPSGIDRAVRKLGAQVARRMFLLVETLDAEGLERVGFLDRLVEKAEVAAVARGLAETAAGFAPMAVQGMKRTIDELSRRELDAEAARARIAACWASEDLQEGVAAMKEKRAPVFKGR
ncbi:enoyl-CoA hydratase/isomerase family protein [Rhodovulum sp. DZ06]|uniref:enoyl-CoA hydratase/isomerase family protein n=1 Tax=Rhodovulum sp. DZ06 TaxID=3425126 RepID=UPI003D35032E